MAAVGATESNQSGETPERRAGRAGRRAPCVRDARGRGAPFLDPYDPRLRGREAGIPGETLRRIRRDLGFGPPRWRQRVYLASVAIFLGCIVFLAIWKLVRGTGADAVERVLWPVNLLVFAVGALAFWRGARRARSRRVRSVMLRHRRCPHCGYDLRDLPPDPADGATVCPECGAAWSLPAAAGSDPAP